MATSGSAVGAYSGRTGYTLALSVARGTVSGTTARWNWSLVAYRNNSYISYVYGAYPWSVNVLGQVWEGSHNLDFSGGAASILIAQGTTGPFNQGTSTKVITFSSNHRGVEQFGTASNSGSFTADRIATSVPATPYNPVFRSATPTSLTFTIANAGDGGRPITNFRMQCLKSDGTVRATWLGMSSSQTSPATLSPGFPYRVRYAAINSNGQSAWSGIVVMTTSAASTPVVRVAPSQLGTFAVLTPTSTPTPPSWRYERRVLNASTADDSGILPPSGQVPGTPGVSYQWRCQGIWQDSSGPWSGWYAGTMPNPGTSPGEYFDGDTPDGTDTTYQWTGTANASTSQQVGYTPAGWALDPGDSGLTGALVRVAGGLGPHGQDYAARLSVTVDESAPGYFLGTEGVGAAETAEGGVYAGSIYVLPSRAMALAAEILWLDDSGAQTGRSPGEPSMVLALPESGTRLSVLGTAPAGTTHALVGVTDDFTVSDDDDADAAVEWGPLVVGDLLRVDAAMLTIGQQYPYFDGATPDTAQFLYDWTGDPNASTSQRTELDAIATDPLADPDCPPPVAAPRPPVIDSDCIVEVGSWRRYWVIIPAGEVSEWLEVVPTITISTGDSETRQVRIRYYENPNGDGPETFDSTSWDWEQIVSYLPADATLVIDGVSQRTTASVDGGETWLPADQLLYGTGGVPATWPVLSCGIGYLVSLDVPLDAPDGNLTVALQLTDRML